MNADQTIFPVGHDIHRPELGHFYPCDLPFYQTIHESKEINGELHLIENLSSIGPNKILVRESYRMIANGICDTLNCIMKAVVTGTPGVGKSFFMIYLLRRLVLKQKRVLFIFFPDMIYYDGSGGVWEVVTLPYMSNRSFWTRDLWCLFDSKEKSTGDLRCIPYTLCSIVISMSPTRRDLINDFVKPPRPQFYYMPPWLIEELEQISSNFPAVDWRRRFEFLGGVPRKVLEDVKDDPEQILTDACNGCSLDDCVNIVGTVAQSLVHITSSSPYTTCDVAFVSKKAMEAIIRHMLMNDRRKAFQLLSSFAGNSITFALSRYIFEPHALASLKAGGEFQSRRLPHGNDRQPLRAETVTIPPSQPQIVERIEGNVTLNQLYVPKTKTFTNVDAWMPGVGLFQITVGEKTRDLDMNTDEQLKRIIDPERFFWGVPPKTFWTFSRQAYPEDIPQYALMIPYPAVTGPPIPILMSEDDVVVENRM